MNKDLLVKQTERIEGDESYIEVFFVGFRLLKVDIIGQVVICPRNELGTSSQCITCASDKVHSDGF